MSCFPKISTVGRRVFAGAFAGWGCVFIATKVVGYNPCSYNPDSKKEKPRESVGEISVPSSPTTEEPPNLRKLRITSGMY